MGETTGTGQDTVRWEFQKNDALSFSVKGIGPKEWKAGTLTEPCTALFIIALFTRTQMWKWVSTDGCVIKKKCDLSTQRELFNKN